MSEATANP